MMSDLIIKLHMIERLRAENAELRDRVELLEEALEEAIHINWFSDVPDDIRELVREAFAATEQGSTDELVD
jgi:hypothetical protein